MEAGMKSSKGVVVSWDFAKKKWLAVRTALMQLAALLKPLGEVRLTHTNATCRG